MPVWTLVEIFRSAGWLKPVVFAVSPLPAAYLIWQVYLLTAGQGNTLGADPAKAIVFFNGDWALRFMLLTLAVTPLRKLTGWPPLARLRRMLGLFAFTYATLHFAAFTVLILELRLQDLGAELVERPYILLGFVAWLGLVPLAVTSNQYMLRRLKQRWKKLHLLVFPVVIIQLAHLFWLTRTDYTEPLAYSVVVVLLLGYRLVNRAQRASRPMLG
ncbi:MAG: sulfoxide reductase heme-binding subunit YedZ [Candidatus Azotimanducaceae bacterium]|jgi:sulfoxide reductase heme-binding subunit YedZ